MLKSRHGTKNNAVAQVAVDIGLTAQGDRSDDRDEARDWQPHLEREVAGQPWHGQERTEHRNHREYSPRVSPTTPAVATAALRSGHRGAARSEPVAATANSTAAAFGLV
jgi:hypothetical protein